ncbi:MAG: alpha/beta hydrolase [Saprospiraceae bacterium]|nr:alpha/beta hydrolase [Saprospiraceae bacterium]
MKISKCSIILLCISLWLWQILLWTWPKGNRIEEAIHLPRHLWTLSNKEIIKNISNEKHFYGEHPKQYFMYYPATSESKKNTVIFFIHGGGWCFGSPYEHRFLAKLLQQQGYTLIFPAYRLTPEFSYPDIKEDINNAFINSINFLKQKGIQDPKLIIGGTSAGANLANLLAFDEKRWDSLYVDRKCLYGVFSIAGVLSLDDLGYSYTLTNYTGPINSKQYLLANPINYINEKDSFPFLCLHGDSDGLAPYKNATSFCTKLKNKSSVILDFHTFKNCSHIDLGSSWYYDEKDNFGQDTILINWLKKISN